jgi:hypothetical protein
MRTTQALPLMSAHGKKENRCRDHPHKEKPERDWTGTCQWGKQAGENQHRGLTGMNKIELENSDPLGKQSYRLRRQKNRTKRRNEDWVPAPLGRENQGRTRPRTKIAGNKSVTRKTRTGPGQSNRLAQKPKVGTLPAEDYSTTTMARVAHKTEPG